VRENVSPANDVNAQYTVARVGSLASRVSANARWRMYQRFIEQVRPASYESILDVGATPDTSFEESNPLERWYPHKEMITAVGMDDLGPLRSHFPQITYCRADGRRLPFNAQSFDVVHSHAVLEHVGSARSQAMFIAELVRVARRAVYLTTPNRWYPVEFHSLLPLLHWLPKRVFRAILLRTKYRPLAFEENLNLLTRNELTALVGALEGCDFTIDRLKTFGMPSNLLVTIRRKL